MNSEPPIKREPPTQQEILRGLSSANLAKRIFAADVPEKLLRGLPAQSLFMALKHNGMGSSVELVSMASIEQCRLLLDFDLWEKDQFDESQLWPWLELADEDQDLNLVRKIIKSIDLKLIALMVSRHVETVICENPNDQAPGPGFYTPDNGGIWVRVKLEDGTKHFNMGRLLAVLFEMSRELFYQILSVPSVSTDSMLEEEAYNERNKRLEGEGIPERAFAAEINSPANVADLKKIIDSKISTVVAPEVPVVQPLFNDINLLKPFSLLFEEAADRDALEAELTMVMNAALIYWLDDLQDYEAIKFVLEKVKGAINIGLEQALAASQLSVREIHQLLGVRKLYRWGLAQLHEVRRKVLSANAELLKQASSRPDVFSVFACMREPFPFLPISFQNDRMASGPEDNAGPKYRAIESSKDLESVSNFITKALTSAEQ